MRRSSRSVCANIAEAWRKRRYEAALIAKLSDAESEACETQVWLEFASKCNYLDMALRDRLDGAYDQIIAQVVRMIKEADKWLIRSKQTKKRKETVPGRDGPPSPIHQFSAYK